MKCDICGTAEAVIHIRQVTESIESEFHLCENCALLRGINTQENRVELSISNLLTGLVDFKDKTEAEQQNITCPKCRQTLLNFRKYQKLGCSECFTAFAQEIKSILRRVNSESRHKGKYPRKYLAYQNYLEEIKGLKIKLEAAVKVENYEEAAKLRDEIKEREASARREYNVEGR
jgi:protein arginine kinase activator